MVRFLAKFSKSLSKTNEWKKRDFSDKKCFESPGIVEKWFDQIWKLIDLEQAQATLIVNKMLS